MKSSMNMLKVAKIVRPYYTALILLGVLISHTQGHAWNSEIHCFHECLVVYDTSRAGLLLDAL